LRVGKLEITDCVGSDRADGETGERRELLVTQPAYVRGCHLEFTADRPDDLDFYQFKLAGRGEQAYSRAELADAGWIVDPWVGLRISRRPSKVRQLRGPSRSSEREAG
jgi:hypothetical protein